MDAVASGMGITLDNGTRLHISCKRPFNTVVFQIERFKSKTRNRISCGIVGRRIKFIVFIDEI